jgi:hypothetical protein
MELDKSKIKTFNRLSDKEVKPFTINFLKGRGKVGFSVGLQKETNMQVGSMVSFINFDKDWYMVVNDDPEGYVVSRQYSKRDTDYFAINSAYFHRHFLQQINGQAGDMYYVQKSKHELDGRPLYEILTNKPVSAFGEK